MENQISLIWLFEVDEEWIMLLLFIADFYSGIDVE